MEVSSDSKLKIRYNTCIAEGDAHAIDVEYHKDCWTRHVFHAQRGETSHVEKGKEDPVQLASFIELLNIVDTQTKAGDYLSMEDVEHTYLSLLGGTDALASHSPAFQRKWLKEKILSELPGVKSVRQKNMRLLAVLYCPGACEAHLVQDAISVAADDDDTDRMKTLYKSAKIIHQRIEKFTKTVKASSPLSSSAVANTLADVPTELYTLIRWIMAGQSEMHVMLLTRLH